MKLEGLKINFLGDSITEGCGTSCEAARFTKLIETEQKLAVMRNYGIGGTRIARQHSVSANTRWDRDFCSRVAEMDPDADAVVVFGGTNDFGQWCRFETLTLCHFDTSIVIKELLDASEIEWLNAYNAKVFQLLSPRLPSEIAQWLRNKTLPI